METKESWLPVQNYGGRYQVSSCGRIKSMNRVVSYPDGKTRKVSEKIMSPRRDKDGYLTVSLSMNGASKTYYIHRLVAGEFLANPGNLPVCNHRDGNKANNHVENLEWVTYSENVQHAFATGLSNNKGGNHCFAVGVIDNGLGMEFSTVREWCAARGIPYGTGKNILNGRRKSRIIDLTKISRVDKTRTNE
jgi:hypothetical protein